MGNCAAIQSRQFIHIWLWVDTRIDSTDLNTRSTADMKRGGMIVRMCCVEKGGSKRRGQGMVEGQNMND